MAETFTRGEDTKASDEKHRPDVPEEGDSAPDFELRDTKGENPVRLSDFEGEKPVALVFGSFT